MPDQPYHLHIVLHVGNNRFLTTLFQEKVQREVRDQLQLSFGKLAQIEVLRTHPLLADIETRGLQAALDGQERLSDAQTHFVLVDHQAGAYTIQVRCQDGFTGMASPLLRQATTTDRGEIGFLAAKLVEESFSPIGVLQGEGKNVRLVVRGGNLSGGWAKRIKPGNVFAVSRVTREGETTRVRRLAWALAEAVEPVKEGACGTRYWHRFLEDRLVRGGSDGSYRCLLLPTVETPLSLRFLDDESFQPLDGLQVHILGSDLKQREELSSQRDGLATTRGRVPHLAIVQVTGGAGVRAQFPVAALTGQVVTVRLKARPEAEGLASLELRRDQWLRRLYDNLRLAGERSVELNQLLGQSMSGALTSARGGLAGLEEEIQQLKQESLELKQQAAGLKPAPPRFDLGEGEQRLSELVVRHGDLKAFVDRLDKVLAESKGEKTLGLQAMIERARLLEGEADYDQAIQMYQKVTQASPEQTKIKAHLEQLEKTWPAKGPRHLQARTFIYDVWPKLEIGDLSKNLEKAREALAACQDAQDRLSPRRLLQANVVHTASLKKKLETLRAAESEDNRNQARQLSVVVEGLVRLHGDTVAFLAKK